MGTKHIFFDALSSPVPDITLIQELQSDVLLIDRYQDLSRSLYSIFSVSSLIPARLKGAILNRVPPPIVTEVRERITRSLADKALPRPAVLPESAWLSSRSLAAIKKLLGGKALSGAGALDQPVAGMTVGSRELKGDLSLFRRVYNKLVLLKPAAVGDAEEEPGSPRTIAGILLTGGRKPPGALLEAAAKTGIPLVLVEADTFTAIEQLEEHPPHLFSSDESKVRRFMDLLDQAGGLPFMQEYPAR
jgi:BioD-like phosphotransacetylase family protein